MISGIKYFVLIMNLSITMATSLIAGCIMPIAAIPGRSILSNFHLVGKFRVLQIAFSPLLFVLFDIFF